MNKKLMQGLLFLLVFFPATAAHAQIPAVQHVIIVVQENRTPDNIFQDPNLISNGADISKTAYCEGDPNPFTLQPFSAIDSCFNPNHDHKAGFMASYDAGNNTLDNGCNVPPDTTGENCTWPGSYAGYTYVENSVTSPNSDILGPYFTLAENYGFANYMFQTNQGPSYLAHQFLFSGTSAPVAYGDPSGLWNLFAAENPAAHLSGCFSPTDTKVKDVNSLGVESYAYTPLGADAGYPCYNHPSMADLLDGNDISWKYYTNQDQNTISIWTAPNSLQEICEVNPGANKTCISPPGNNDWSKVDDTAGDILNDIGNPSCTALPAVSWVMPDGNWSDHPGLVEKNGTWTGSTGGPSWIAAIVNAIGNDPHNCGYWGGSQNTVILITWDDWGGWYDHVPPYNTTLNGITGGYPNASGLASGDGRGYVYGARVPLLVVAAYMNETVSGTPGYISGNINENDGGIYYQGKNPPYIHDFGSILGYVEYVFGLNTFTPTTPYPFGIAGGNPTMFPGSYQYPYADFYAPDSPANSVVNPGLGCPIATCPYPLWDFFSNPQYHAFTPITAGVLYQPICFLEPQSEGCFGASFPQDPDNE